MPPAIKKAWGFVDNFFYNNDMEEEYYRKMREKSSSISAFVVGLVAAVGGFLYGYDTGLINDILEMQYVTGHFPSNGNEFNVHERALITAILSLGTFCGAITAPIISDNYGRRFSIMLSSGGLFTVGTILQIAANSNVLLCIGRFVSGVAVGNLSAIVPLYQAEASPKWVRGSVVYLYQWAITWGLLVASAVCQGTRRLSNSGSYRIPIGLQFLFTMVLFGGMLFLPESPRFYVQKNNLEKALDSLSKLRRIENTDPDLIEELVEIKASYDYEVSFGKTKWIDCFRNGGGRHQQVLRMLTGMGVHVFQQCSGINFIFYYGVNFFSSTGLDNYYLMSFITYAVNTAFTIPGILLIEIIGRRKLLLGGGLGMSVSNFIIGIVGVSVVNSEIRARISISFSCLFIAFFAASWGGCCWALTSDLYGISIRQKAISITASTNWLVNFTFAYITPYLIDTGAHTAALGNKIFFIWGGCNAVGTIFVYFIVYETKGLKLEEVDYMYKVCHSPRESTKFKSTKIEYDNITPYRFISREIHDIADISLTTTSERNRRQKELGYPTSSDSNNTNVNSHLNSHVNNSDNDAIDELYSNSSTPRDLPSSSSSAGLSSSSPSPSINANKAVASSSNPNIPTPIPVLPTQFGPTSSSLAGTNGDFKNKDTPNNITIIPYHNTLSPSISPDSVDETSHPGSSMHSEPELSYKSDYEKYLDTLKATHGEDLTSDKYHRYDSSQTSASIFNSHRSNSKSNTNSNDLEITRSTVIATPFFNAPPSDSDSSDQDSEES